MALSPRPCSRPVGSCHPRRSARGRARRRPFGESTMLPRAAYLEPETLAWERAHLLNGWVCVGRSTEMPDTGMRAESNR